MTPRQVADVLEKEGISTYDTIRQEMVGMVKDEELRRPHRGVYALPAIVNSQGGDQAPPADWREQLASRDAEIAQLRARLVQKEGPPPKRAAQLGEAVEDVEAARAAGERVIDMPDRASVQPKKRPDDAAEPTTFPFVIFDLEGEDFLELEVRAKGRADALRFTVGVRSGREGQEIKMRRPDAEGEATRANEEAKGGAG